MKRKLIKLSIVFVFGVVVGIWFARLFSGSHPNSSKIVAENPTRISAILSKTEKLFNTRIDSMDRINTALNTKVLKTQTALVQAKQQNRTLQRTVTDLLTVHYTATDTVTQLENCDSLTVAVQDLLAQNSKKDSLYENLATDLQGQVTLRDSLIEIKDAKFDSLELSFSQSLIKQQELVQENLAQKKVIKKEKRRKGFLTALLMVVSGLFIYNSVK